MSKKFKIMALVGLAAILTIIGIAVPVMADATPTPSTQATAKIDFLAQVAQKLGVTREQLVDAFKQAREQLKGVTPAPDTAAAKLDALLGKAAEILGKPKADLMAAFQNTAKELRETGLTNALNKAVENKIITPDEEKQIQDWYAQRPAAVDKLLNFRGFRGWCQKRIFQNHVKQQKEQGENRINIPAKPSINSLRGTRINPKGIAY